MCVDRMKEESVITLLVMPTSWNPAVRLKHHRRSRSPLDFDHAKCGTKDHSELRWLLGMPKAKL
jgi:hypothetical protein